MGLSQNSFQAGATAKKQQSISSFFTRNASTPDSPPTVALKASHDSRLSFPIGNSQNLDENLFVEPGEDDASSLISRRVSRTPKRGLETQEEDEDRTKGEHTLDLPKTKRVRSSDTNENRRSTDIGLRASNGHTLTPIAANEVKKSKASDRTSKYAFSSSPAGD